MTSLGKPFKKQVKILFTKAKSFILFVIFFII